MITTVNKPTYPMRLSHFGVKSAWELSRLYAGEEGHIASLPDIVEARLAAMLPWEMQVASSSFEFFGIGADGRAKVIVAHNGGPLSTIEAIVAAYEKEVGDTQQYYGCGLVSAQLFLDLEAGLYGEVENIKATAFRDRDGNPVGDVSLPPVTVLDLQSYLYDACIQGQDPFGGYLTAAEASGDALLRMRLGPQANSYLKGYESIVLDWIEREGGDLDSYCQDGSGDRSRPCIVHVECPFLYLQLRGVSSYEPSAPPDGCALGNPLAIDCLRQVCIPEYGHDLLISSLYLPTLPTGASSLIAVPHGAQMSEGVVRDEPISVAVRRHWRRFLRPVEEGHTLVPPYRLTRCHGEWFTYYSDESHAREGSIEFHVRSVEPIGDDITIAATAGELFPLEQLREIMPDGANGFEVIDIDPVGHGSQVFVTVRFYRADVDTSQYLPRT